MVMMTIIDSKKTVIIFIQAFSVWSTLLENNQKCLVRITSFVSLILQYARIRNVMKLRLFD